MSLSLSFSSPLARSHSGPPVGRGARARAARGREGAKMLAGLGARLQAGARRLLPAAGVAASRPALTPAAAAAARRPFDVVRPFSSLLGFRPLAPLAGAAGRPLASLAGAAWPPLSAARRVVAAAPAPAFASGVRHYITGAQRRAFRMKKHQYTKVILYTLLYV